MNAETTKVKCPLCGAPLMIKRSFGIESKIIACPSCREESRFTDFIPFLQDTKDEITTVLDDSIGNDSTLLLSKEEPAPFNDTIGLLELQVKPRALRFQLHKGKNIIGRKASKSMADIQLPLSPESKKTSREHLIIDVVKEPKRGLTHYISLYKEQVNETFVGNQLLTFGAHIELTDGTFILLPDAKLQFILPDEEKTELVTYDKESTICML